jgi:Ca2+-binding RTX toxin-like protein
VIQVRDAETMMATFTGTDFRDYIDTFFYDDLVPGYYGELSDIVYGYDGDDLIYGFEGHDDLYGGYGYDTIHGGTGDDLMSGDDGDDYLNGGSGHDDLYGGYGHDDLYGGAGLDFLSGGTGDDFLSGGTGRDTLSGGAGSDIFSFKKGESGFTKSTVDTITDWNRSHDWIDMAVKGTSSNYRERATKATSIATAVDEAEHYFPKPSIKHVFLYNGRTDTGYLISDSDGNGQFDTGIVLKNAGLASDMSYQFII